MSADHKPNKEQSPEPSLFRTRWQDKLRFFAHSVLGLYAWFIFFSIFLGLALTVAIYFAVPAAGLSFAALLGLTGSLAYAVPLLVLSLANIGLLATLFAFLLRIIFNQPGFMKITIITSTVIGSINLGIFLAAASPSIFSLLPALGLTGPAALAVSLFLAAVFSLAVMSSVAYSLYLATVTPAMEAKTPRRLSSSSSPSSKTSTPAATKVEQIELPAILAALLKKIAAAEVDVLPQLKSAQQACLNALSAAKTLTVDQEEKNKLAQAILHPLQHVVVLGRKDSLLNIIRRQQIAMVQAQLAEKFEQTPLNNCLGQLINILLGYDTTATNTEYHLYMKNTFGFAAKLLSNQFTHNTEVYIRFMEAIYAGDQQQALLALHSLNPLCFDQELAHFVKEKIEEFGLKTGEEGQYPAPNKAKISQVFASLQDLSNSIPNATAQAHIRTHLDLLNQLIQETAAELRSAASSNNQPSPRNENESSHRYQSPLSRSHSQSTSVDPQQSEAVDEHADDSTHQDKL